MRTSPPSPSARSTSRQAPRPAAGPRDLLRKRRRRGCGARQGGFTLIEIVAVVLLLSLVMGTVAANLDGLLPGSRTESAARELVGTLDFARTHALSYGHPYEVILDFDQQRYAIRTPFDAEGRRAPDPRDREMLSWHPMRDGVVLDGVLDARGEVVSRGQYVIRFDPGGSAQDLYLYLANEEGDAHDLTVRLLALTGLSSVSQGREVPAVLTEDDF